MREMDKKALVYEALLKLYYDDSIKIFLSGEIKNILDSFVEYCKAKDIVDNTQIVETMALVYNPQNNVSKSELKSILALSDSSFYRFRVKIIHSLQNYISEQYDIK